MTARIDEDSCVGCGACLPACPTASITLGLVAVVDAATCSDDADCVAVCPQACIQVQAPAATTGLPPAGVGGA